MDWEDTGADHVQMDKIGQQGMNLTRRIHRRPIIAPRGVQLVTVQFIRQLIDIPQVAGNNPLDKPPRAMNEWNLHGTRFKDHHVRVHAKLSQRLVQEQSDTSATTARSHRHMNDSHDAIILSQTGYGFSGA